MVKTSTKQKVVSYEERENFCDLCEKVIPTDKPMVRVVTGVSEKNGNRWVSSEDHIEVCSDCFTTNAKAIGLLLNTKVIPNTLSNHRKYQKEREKMDIGSTDADFKQYVKYVQPVSKKAADQFWSIGDGNK